MISVAFHTQDVTLYPRLRRLAEQWRLPFLQASADTDALPFLLLATPCARPPGYRLSLCAHDDCDASRISIDFDSAKLLYRVLHGGGRRQALAKALGIGSAASLRLLDLTAGLGQDAFVAAALGCQVTMVERHPAIAALLDNALARARHTAQDRHGKTREAVDRMKLVHADAIEYFSRPSVQTAVDTVYLDPMYPAHSKSAKVKKGMALLQRVLAADPDNSRELLRHALQSGIKRIVLKRPKNAPVIGSPVGQVRSKATRFDLYTGTG